MENARGGVVFDRVTKRYGEVRAVDEVSFEVAPGELVTLLGPSGCGKTTTLRMVAGLEAVTSGRVLIGGTDVTLRAANERDVSMVFQSYALFPHMNVLDNVCYGPMSMRMDRGKARELAMSKLGMLGLAGLESRLPSELSGGQQQRVAVARSLVLEPQVLLFGSRRDGLLGHCPQHRIAQGKLPVFPFADRLGVAGQALHPAPEAGPQLSRSAVVGCGLESRPQSR